MESLYDFFGTSDGKVLATDILVALVLAVSLAFLLLEIYRIITESSKKEQPEPISVEKPEAVQEIKEPIKPAPAIVEQARPIPEPVKKADLPKEPAIQILKGTLPESIKAIVQKYGLNSLTIASFDGLSIASTLEKPEEEAAVFSNAFREAGKGKEPYIFLENKNVHLYEVSTKSAKLIGVARKMSRLSTEEIKGLKEDTKTIIEKFS